MSKSYRRALLVLPILLFPLILTAQWRELSSFSGGFYNEAFFVDNDYGWITEMQDTVFRTADGGSTWQRTILPGARFSYNRDICFISRSIGFVSGEDGVWKTVDGGATFTNISPSTNLSASAGMWFVDGSTGVYAYGTCFDTTATFCRTTDAGATWSITTYNTTQDAAVGGIIATGTTWYAAGGSGKLWTSTDNGVTWSLSNTGSAGWQEDIRIAPGGTIYIASMNGTSCSATGGGKVLCSTNAGSSWTTTSFPSDLMWGVSSVSSTVTWASGDLSHTYKTTDNGVTWNDLSCGIPRSRRIDDIFFSDATHGWAVGDGVYRLSDTGITVAPDTIDFRDVRVRRVSADSLAKVFAYVAGSASVNFQITGPDASQFETRLAGSIPVNACTEERLPVRFKPTSRGPKQALLEFTIQGSNIRHVIVLKGNGIEPEIQVSGPSMIDTMRCVDRAFDSVLVRNIGNGTLTLSGAASLDPPNGMLRVIAPPFPITVPPGAYVWLRVQVVAYTTGPFQSTLQILSDDDIPGHSPSALTIRYYRRGVAVALAPDTLVTLPSTPIGVPTSNGCVEYRNRGDGAQSVTTVTPEKGSTTISFVSPTLPLSLEAGLGARLCFQGIASDTGWFERRFRIHTEPCGLDTFVTVRFYATNPIVASDTASVAPAMQCDDSTRAIVRLYNRGNDTLVVSAPSIVPSAGSRAAVISPTAWPARVLRGDSLDVAFALASTAGPARAQVTFQTNDRFPGKDRWTVSIAATRLRGRVDAENRRIDLDTFCLGDFRSGTVLVHATGDIPSSISSIIAIDTLAGLEIVRDPSGVQIIPGSSDSVIVRATGLRPGPFSAQYALRSAPCGEIDTIVVTGFVSDVLLSADGPAVFGTVAIGNASTTRVIVRNTGNVDARVVDASFVPPVAELRIVSPAIPFAIPAGGTAPIDLEINTSDTGTIATQLMLTALEQCSDTLAIGVEATLVDPGGRSILLNTPSLTFGERFDCQDTCAEISLSAVGRRPVMVTGARLPAGLRITSTLPTVLEPGTHAAIIVCFDPASVQVPVGPIILTTDDPEAAELSVEVSGSLAPRASIVGAVDFGVVPQGGMRDTAIWLHNPSSLPLRLTAAQVDAPWSLLTALPVDVPPRDSVALQLRADWQSEPASGWLRIATSNPCGDTPTVALRSRSDDRYVVRAVAASGMGRWGSDIEIPIGYVDSLGARLQEFEMEITASSNLLDPRDVRAAHEDRIRVEKLGYNASTGTLRISVRAAIDFIPADDTLLKVTWRVLRGDQIQTSIVPRIVAFRTGVQTAATAGTFTLADYCDAYGRLLTTTGGLLLAQNVPNPFDESTSIEIEIPHADNVRLVLYNSLGEPVRTVLNETMPAGRRIVGIDGRDLPSGAYTCRMFVGLQVLSRRIVVRH